MNVLAAPPTVTLTLDGRPVTVPAGTTIWEAAKAVGTDIPALCHSPKLRPVGVCRMCVVDVGGRVLAASCVRACEEGMKVETGSPKVEKQRRMLTALLLADHPSPCDKERTTRDCELEALGRKYDLINSVGSPSPPVATGGLDPPPKDLSSPVIAVDHAACILCDRCIRACDEVQCNEVIGRTGKGYPTRIGFDLDNPMGQSTCVSLRRVRRRLPDRGADQQADHPAAGPALGNDERRERLPVLRRRLRDHLSRQRSGEQDRLGRGPRRRRQRRPALRQGPLRVGLRHPRTAPHEAADPPAGVLPQGAAVE